MYATRSLSRLFITMALAMSVFIAESEGQVTREVTNNTQFWTSINTTLRASDKWGAIADIHIRRTNFVKDPNFYFARIGGAYFLDSRFSVVAGYAHLWLATNTDVGLKYSNENRIYQQALWRSKIERVTLLQRVRTEQRWQEVLDTEDGSVSSIRFTNRIRFLFSMTLQVFDNPKLPRFVVADEVHIHFGEDVVYNTFNQNRIFVGISQRIAPQASFDFGYMNVYQQAYSGFEYDSNHTIRLFFYYTPDFRKRKNADFPHYPLLGEE